MKIIRALFHRHHWVLSYYDNCFDVKIFLRWCGGCGRGEYWSGSYQQWIAPTDQIWVLNMFGRGCKDSGKRKARA